MLRRLNPFRRRLRVPIRKMPGGWEPWNNRQPPKRMSWRPIMLGCGTLLCLCGVLPGGVVFLLSSAGGTDVTPTLDVTNIIQEYIDNRTMATTPDLTSIVQEMSATQTPSPTAMTSTITATVQFTEMAMVDVETTPAPQITVRSYSQPAALPTYTPYPTYTQQPAQQIVVREGGQTIIQTQIVEQPVQQTVLAPVYVIVTATPSASPTPVILPTNDGLWTMEPDFFPSREPVFGMTTTGEDHAATP